MANQNVIGQFKDEIEQVAGETVQNIKDATGGMIEQNVTPQPTPQQIQQKQADEQKQLSYARRYIQDLQMAQAKARAENKQKEEQRLQSQQQEAQQEQVEEVQVKQAKKKQMDYTGKVEFKRGVGG